MLKVFAAWVIDFALMEWQDGAHAVQYRIIRYFTMDKGIDKFFAQLNVMKDITIGVNEKIHEVVEREIRAFEKTHGKPDESKLDTPEGKEYRDKVWAEVIEPILVSALSAVISLFVRSKFPKEEILREVEWIFDDHVAIQKTLSNLGQPEEKLVVKSVKKDSSIPPITCIDPKNKAKLN